MGPILALVLPLVQQILGTSGGIGLIASILPKALDAFASINNTITLAKGRGMGHEEAMKAGAEHAAELLQKALAAEQAAIEQHKKFPDSDEAFDPGVFRKED